MPERHFDLEPVPNSLYERIAGSANPICQSASADDGDSVRTGCTAHGKAGCLLTTIRDVAREAGVGVGTVSRVLSGHASVAPATRARVQTAMEQLNYHPSAVAR